MVCIFFLPLFKQKISIIFSDTDDSVKIGISEMLVLVFSVVWLLISAFTFLSFLCVPTLSSCFLFSKLDV